MAAAVEPLYRGAGAGGGRARGAVPHLILAEGSRNPTFHELGAVAGAAGPHPVGDRAEVPLLVPHVGLIVPTPVVEVLVVVGDLAAADPVIGTPLSSSV